MPLPDHYDASVYFIGRIRTPWTRREDCPKNARESDAVCTIEVDPRWAAALAGGRDLHPSGPALLDGQVAARYRGAGAAALRRRPAARLRLRSPARPNPIAMSVVTLKEVRGASLLVTGLDCLDNTPLIDIKPYFASVDSVPDAEVGWHRDTKR